MEDLEYVIRDSFQLYKATGILISLLLIVLFQSLLPNRLVFRQLLSNWKVNCSVAAINTLLTSDCRGVLNVQFCTVTVETPTRSFNRALFVGPAATERRF